jgi:uncharacterized small protein (DUF1192 family)
MSNPVIEAFFFGRALAEVVNEKLEEGITNAFSELGKFDAEQREKLRQLMVEVSERANQQAQSTNSGSSSLSTKYGTKTSGDLQETIDELRAEIARLRAELQKYRSGLV